MKVKLIAATTLLALPGEWEPSADGYGAFPDTLAEMAGRNCYQSWNRPNPKTATNRGYLKNIIDQGHLSVLEHSSATFYIVGVSTALLGQLTRHRHLSFSVESARYVDKGDIGAVTPRALMGDANLFNLAQIAYNNALKSYDEIVLALVRGGLTNKEARQAARYVLPQSVTTRIFVTGNMRAWREVIAKRTSTGADVEIAALCREILRQLKEIAPNTFQDM